MATRKIIALLPILAIGASFFGGAWAIQANRPWGWALLGLALLLTAGVVAREVRRSRLPDLRSVSAETGPASPEEPRPGAHNSIPVAVPRRRTVGRSSFGSGPHPWPEKGSIVGDVLGALACGVIVAILCALALSGCRRPSSSAPDAAAPTADTARRRAIDDADCKGRALESIAFKLSMEISSIAGDRSLGGKPDPERERRAEALRTEYARIEREGCGL